MSSIVRYQVDRFTIDSSIFKRFFKTEETKARIAEIAILDEDVMTVAQSKELDRLRNNIITLKFNECVITSDPSLNSLEFDIFFNVGDGTAYIPGHEGQNLTFKINPDNPEQMIVDNPWFNDNYDSHLECIKKVIAAFRASTEIIYDGDEVDGYDSEDGSLSEFAGKVMYRYIDGIMMSNPDGLVNG